MIFIDVYALDFYIFFASIRFEMRTANTKKVAKTVAAIATAIVVVKKI